MLDIASLGPLEEFILHPILVKFLLSDAQVRVLVTGNQAGKSAAAMFDLILRILGIHPNPKRNLLPHPVRCVSKCLPKNDEDEENAQYVEFKRRFPHELIKQDVTARSSIVSVGLPSGDRQKVEFMSKNMDLDAFMSVQRSAYYQDEEIDKIKWDESQMRLLQDGGDTVLTLTPVKGMDWTYDNIWRKARTIYRSDTICRVFNLPAVEHMNGGKDIEIFCWATDDNPVMKPEDVDRIMDTVGATGDDDEIAMRRYGVFRQVAGRVYKIFDQKYHKQRFEDVFDEKLFRQYWHYRIIDYHPSKPWFVSFVAISPTQEWFVWNELKLSHDRATTFDLRDIIKEESLLHEDDEYNRRTLIDPLAKEKQPNSGWSVFEDLSRGEEGLRRCESADTKNEQGRMNIRKRLSNALECGMPGNNEMRQSYGDPRFGNYKPTLWFLDSCPLHIEHFMNWRWADWKQEHVKAIRDSKKPTEKWSDFCRNLEFLGAHDPVFYLGRAEEEAERRWFQGRRRVG